MNGQVTPAQAATRPHLDEPGIYDAAAAPLRLLLALALSCALHAAVVFLPYLGTSSQAGRLAPAARSEMPRILDAQLLRIGERDQPIAVAATAEAERRANSPAADRTPAPPGPVSAQRAEGANLLPLPAPVYYTTDQLTKRPQPLAVADLDAPQIQAIVASGKIVLKLWINEFGAVTDVDVEKTELPEVFSRTAIAAFKGLHFAPGERNGQPVPTLMRIEVNYDDGRLKPD